MSDAYAIACNYREPTGIARVGALAYVSNWQADNGYERIRIIVRSRGGRWIQKWENIQRLTNFRSKTLPDRHPMRKHDQIELHPARSGADHRAAQFMMACRRESTATTIAAREARLVRR